jgi:hypothetical protein
MKLWTVFATLAAILALAALPPGARAGSIGVGVVAGEPTGVSFKTWLDGVHAVDGAVGWSLSGDTSLRLHADYLWHDFGLLHPGPPAGRLPVYFGIGGRLQLGDENDRHEGDDRLGVRFPVGIAWIAAAAPIDVFVEVVPVLGLIPGTELDVDAAIGVRFWFR